MYHNNIMSWKLQSVAASLATSFRARRLCGDSNGILVSCFELGGAAIHLSILYQGV